MKVLLIHLSDIHARSQDDPVLRRAEVIAQAVQNLDTAIDHAIVAVSGDLAFAGSEVQYEAVWTFLQDLVAELGRRLSGVGQGQAVPVTIAAIPGNHDCDFSTPSTVRPILIDRVLSQTDLSRDPEIVDSCSKVQQAFFDALADYGSDGIGVPTGKFDQRLAYEYPIAVGDQAVRLLCFNTAWLSQRHEQQGRLYFPADAVPAVQAGDAVVIAMFHHPYNWIQADAAREFRKKIEAGADLILTGHEHDASVRAQQVKTGENNLYIEGGALQDSTNPGESTFNAFVLDLSRRMQKTARFIWDEDRYAVSGAPGDSGDAFGLLWEEFEVARLRQRDQFTVAAAMREYLDDVGVGLAHHGRDVLHLSDIFVYPDLQQVSYGVERTGRVVRGPEIGNLVSDSSRLLVAGDNQAGKSALAKVVYNSLLQGGYAPVLLDGTKSLPSGDRLEAYLVDRFGEQYQPADKEAYRQLDRSRRAIVVDDFHLIALKPSQRIAFLEVLTGFANKVILFANDLWLESTDFLRPTGRMDGPAFAIYKIMPLGYLRRDEMIDKWLLLNGDADASAESILRSRQRVTDTLDGLIGRSWLPPYPVYVLAVLQGNEAVTPMDTQISTHGAYYEIFIRAAIQRGRVPVQADILRSYLAYLAFSLYVRGVKELDSVDFDAMHREFERLYEIRVDAGRLKSELDRCGILAVSEGIVRFKYKYVYYYFVASWLQHHIRQPDIRAKITALTRSVYVEEHANILLFLAHLSKDPLIVDEMLAATRSFYPDIPPAAFADDVAFLLDLEPGASQIEYEESDIDERRKRQLAILDERETHKSEDYDVSAVPDEISAADILDPIVKFNAAVKTLEILGQILKNFPGSIEGDVKVEMARACYSLGLRAVAWIYEEFRANEVELLNDVMSSIREQHPRLLDAEVADRARRTVVDLAEMVGVGIVRLVTAAVGSPELSQTYRRVLAQDNTPAVRLIDTSINLHHSGVFQEDLVLRVARDLRSEPFASTILSYLIVGYFHVFPVKGPVKQQICNALGIKYTALYGANPTRRLLGGG